jgi:hypothetical protein
MKESFCDKSRLVLVDLPSPEEFELEDKLCLERVHSCGEPAPLQDLLGLECAHLAHSRDSIQCSASGRSRACSYVVGSARYESMWGCSIGEQAAMATSGSGLSSGPHYLISWSVQSRSDESSGLTSGWKNDDGVGCGAARLDARRVSSAHHRLPPLELANVPGGCLHECEEWVVVALGLPERAAARMSWISLSNAISGRLDAVRYT